MRIVDAENKKDAAAISAGRKVLAAEIADPSLSVMIVRGESTETSHFLQLPGHDRRRCGVVRRSQWVAPNQPHVSTRLWPSRAIAELKFAAVNRSSRAGQQEKVRAGHQGPVVAATARPSERVEAALHPSSPALSRFDAR